ncbi:hypothetical protein WSK_1967 [Novosphingobium sp. Rr 2-17]|nr:hypothetical protein WSK_1967 [Novosphingobium sp. Rr 2-17]
MQCHARSTAEIEIVIIVNLRLERHNVRNSAFGKIVIKRVGSPWHHLFISVYEVGFGITRIQTEAVVRSRLKQNLQLSAIGTCWRRERGESCIGRQTYIDIGNLIAAINVIECGSVDLKTIVKEAVFRADLIRRHRLGIEFYTCRAAIRASRHAKIARREAGRGESVYKVLRTQVVLKAGLVSEVVEPFGTIHC